MSLSSSYYICRECSLLPCRTTRKGNRCAVHWNTYNVTAFAPRNKCIAPRFVAAGPNLCCFTALHGRAAAQRFALSTLGEEQGEAAGSAASFVIGVSGRQASVFYAPETHARSYVKQLAERFRLAPAAIFGAAFIQPAWGACLPKLKGHERREGGGRAAGMSPRAVFLCHALHPSVAVVTGVHPRTPAYFTRV